MLLRHTTPTSMSKVSLISTISPKKGRNSFDFLRWSNDNENFYCFPLWFVLFLPYGTEVTRINGDKFKYAEDTDLDIRLGCVAFGVELKD